MERRGEGRSTRRRRDVIDRSSAFQVATVLQATGWELHRRGQPTKAIENLRASLVIFGGVAREITPTSVIVEARYRLAEVEFTLGKLGKAIEILTNTIQMCEEIGFVEDKDLLPACANCAFLLGDIYKLLFKFDESIANYKWCVNHEGASERELLRSEQRLASVDIASGRFRIAKDRLIKLRTKQRRLFRGTTGQQDQLDYAETCNDLGELLSVTGFYEESLYWLDQAYKIRYEQLGADHYITGETRLRIANVHIARDEFTKAEEILQQVYETTDAQVTSMSHKMVPILFSLGRAKFGQGKLEAPILTALWNNGNRDHGKFQEALEQAGRALNLAKLVFGENNGQVLKIAIFIAEVHLSVSNIGEIDQPYTDALRIAQHWSEIELGPMQAEVHRIKALRSSRGRDYPEAMRQLGLCYESLVSFFTRDHPDLASVLCLMGELYMYFYNNFQQAGDKYDEARRVNVKIFGEEHPRVAYVLFKLSYVYEGMRDTPEAMEKARTCAKESWEIYELKLGDDNAKTKDARDLFLRL